MDSSFANSEDLECPRCHHAFTCEVWLIVDGDARPDLLERVTDGTLHSVRCPQCESEIGRVDIPLLLLRREAEPALLFLPADQTSSEEDQAAFEGLMVRLREALGDEWDGAWDEEDAVPFVPRSLLGPLLSGDAETAIRAMAEQMAERLAQIQEEEPEALEALTTAMREAMAQNPLAQAMQELLLSANKWTDVWHVIGSHPILLSDDAEAQLAQMAQFAEAMGGDVAQLNALRMVVQRSREIGAKAAVAEKLGVNADDLELIERVGGASAFHRAVDQFISAPDEATARTVFEQERSFLQQYSALQALDQLIAPSAAQPDVQRRLVQARQWLVAWRRDEQPPLAPHTGSSMPIPSDALTPVPQLPGIQSEGDHNLNVVINDIRDVQWDREWLPPALPAPQKLALIPRKEKVNEIATLLRQQQGAAIVSAAAIQGMPGNGKTMLATLLGQQQVNDYPAGILWRRIGPDLTTAEQCNSILNEWASHAFGGQEKRFAEVQFAPSVVRSLLAEAIAKTGGPLLIVLDDVWHVPAISPLRDALPPGAHLLITTRSNSVVRDLAIKPYELGLLSRYEEKDGTLIRDEALELLFSRLPKAIEVDTAWLLELAEGLGRHALALDIAASTLHVQSEGHWEQSAERLRRAVREGRDFGGLREGESGERWVEISLRHSYEAMRNAEEQRRFRMLGVLAIEADFETSHAAALWGCDVDDARLTLDRFVGMALLNRHESPRDYPDRYRQHSLLHGYARALLRQQGELDEGAARHAQLFTELMRKADEAQHQHTMLPWVPQLRAAFAWAIENDLGLALNLNGQAENLHAAFFDLAREGFTWVEQGVTAARAHGDQRLLAQALVTYGNALSRVATWHGEDRRARLLDALDAYDQALRFLRPEVMPLDYAMTQNNRATLLSAMATLPGEDRRGRLLAALAAYDEALRFRRPEVVPLDYAMTQNNRATLLSAMATLPGEDRRGRLLAALAAAYEAAGLYRGRHAQYAEISQRTFQRIRAACGDDFAVLWAALDVGPLPDWLDEPSATDQEAAVAQAFQLFLQAQSPDQMEAILTATPALLEIDDEPLFDQLKNHYADNQEALSLFTTKQALLRACREQGTAETFATLRQAAETMQDHAPLLTALAQFQSAYQTAADDDADATAWQRATEAGAALLALPHDEISALIGAEALPELQRMVAAAYNGWGYALGNDGDKEGALSAYDGAIALEPDFAMWRRNRTGTLIELQRLDAAETELGRARALEPDAARLDELAAELAAARRG